MSREDAHFRKLNRLIKAASNEAASNGLLGSGALCQKLCLLISEAVKDYFDEVYSDALNAIKSGKITEEQRSSFLLNIKKELLVVIEKDKNVYENQIKIILRSHQKKEKIDSILKELDFSNEVENKIDKVISKFEMDLFEYLQKKTRDEQALIFAKEANHISKKSLWITSIISLLAIIVSLISLWFSVS